MNWISDSTKSPLSIPPSEDKARRYLLIRKKAFTAAHSCWHLDLGLPSSHSYRKYISVFYRNLFPSLWYFVIAAWVDKEHQGQLFCQNWVSGSFCLLEFLGLFHIHFEQFWLGIGCVWEEMGRKSISLRSKRKMIRIISYGWLLTEHML